MITVPIQGFPRIRPRIFHRSSLHNQDCWLWDDTSTASPSEKSTSVDVVHLLLVGHMSARRPLLSLRVHFSANPFILPLSISSLSLSGTLHSLSRAPYRYCRQSMIRQMRIGTTGTTRAGMPISMYRMQAWQMHTKVRLVASVWPF